MIANLFELNEKVMAFSNYVVKTACEKTTSGQYYVSVDDACEAVGLSLEDFFKYKDFIVEELFTREELLEFDYSADSMEFDVNCGLNYCPSYQWCDGDEAIFECTFEEWFKRPALPVAQPLSVSRMAEIGVDAISYLAYREEKDLESVVKGSLGLEDSVAASVIGAVEKREREVVGKLETTILENDAKLKQRDTAVELDTYFTVRDGFGDDIGDKYHPSYDKALEAFKAYCISGVDGVDGAMLGIVCKTADKTHKCVLVQNVVNEYDENVYKPQYENINWDSLVVPEIELAALRAKQLRFPFDEVTQNRINELEKQLGCYERGVDTSNDLFVGKWRVHLVPTGARHGFNNNLVNENEKTLIEFYDMSVEKASFPYGQFAADYYVSTLLGEDSISGGPFESMRYGLCLDGENAKDWTVSGKEMSVVFEWLRMQPLKECDIVKPSLNEYIEAAQAKNNEAPARRELIAEKDR